MPSICSKQLSPGDVVYECKPLIHILKTEYKGKYCDNCLQRSDSLKRCAKCLQMYYCDKNCQTFDWIQHKNECKLFRPVVHVFLGELDRLNRRFMLCVKYDKTFATKRHQLIDGSDVCLNDIETKGKELLKNTELKSNFEKFEKDFKVFGFNRKELLHWFAVINQSLFRNPIFGFFLCIQTAFISHSCLPNTAIVNNGLTLQVRAMKAIGSGEELTISYVDLAKNKRERLKSLEKYAIVCKCRKCELNLDSDLDYDSFVSLEGMTKWMVSVPRICYLISKLTAIYGLFLPQKTQTLEKIFKVFHAMYASDPSPEAKARIEIVIKPLKEAIPITHGESHPLATDLNQLFAEY